MKKIILFFVIGIAIYLTDIAFNYDESSKDIVITDQEIKSLISAWKQQVGRNPSEDEIIRIINDYLEEEILYREAIALGLDKDDRIIKRRMAQKITFLKQESFVEIPDSKEVMAYFEANKQNYYINSSYTFTHHYFSNENDAQNRSNFAIKNLKNNQKPIDADPFLLGKNFVNKNDDEIDQDFGLNFSKNFYNVNLNEWIGPFQSSYGYHIVKIISKNDGYFPDTIDIYQKIELDYINNKKNNLLEEYISEVKSNYNVIANPDLIIE